MMRALLSKKKASRKPKPPASASSSLWELGPVSFLVLTAVLWLLITVLISFKIYSLNASYGLFHLTHRRTDDSAQESYVSAMLGRLRRVGFYQTALHNTDVGIRGDALNALRNRRREVMDLTERLKVRHPNLIDTVKQAAGKWKIESGLSDKAFAGVQLAEGKSESGKTLQSAIASNYNNRKQFRRKTTNVSQSKFPLYAREYFESHISEEESHNMSYILSVMEYWKAGIDVHNSDGGSGQPVPALRRNKEQHSVGEKYMSFWTDCGGFNNIRMAFEYFVTVAWLTNRTVVLPPDRGWYLITYGQRARGAEHSGSVTRYDEYFDFTHLNLEVPTLSTTQFAQRILDGSVLTNEQLNADSSKLLQELLQNPLGAREQNAYIKWADGWHKRQRTDAAWGPLGYVLNWPSIAAMKANGPEISRELRANREDVEYTSELKASSWMHFPSCHGSNPATDNKYRYLGQVSTAVLFESRAQLSASRRLLRDHVHLRPAIVRMAALAVEYLGLFQFAAIHIRRNELQYKDSFLEAQSSLANVRPLLKETERLYISTDEKSAEFLKPFSEAFEVVSWRTLVASGGPLANMSVPPNWEGEIEMLVCAAARIFFGTDTSTFSSYITRLRGYFQAPDTRTYHHNTKYTGDLLKDALPKKEMWGTVYMDEFPQMWEDIRGTV